MTLKLRKKHPYLPKSGRVLKGEVEKYLNADTDMINQTLGLALQQEKVDYLRSVIKFIEKRGFDIKNAIDFQKFMSGGR